MAARKKARAAKTPAARARAVGRPKSVSDEDLIRVLLEEPSPSRAAERLGVHRNTIVARLRDESVREILREHRARAAEAAAAAMAEIAGEAVQTLRDLIRDSTPQDSVRLGAALAALRFVERTVVEQQQAEKPDEVWTTAPQFELRLIRGGRTDEKS